MVTMAVNMAMQITANIAVKKAVVTMDKERKRANGPPVLCGAGFRIFRRFSGLISLFGNGVDGVDGRD